MRPLLLLLTALAGSEGGDAEVVAYLGDPQIGFSGNETEDTIRFGMVADAVRLAKAVVGGDAAPELHVPPAARLSTPQGAGTRARGTATS